MGWTLSCSGGGVGGREERVQSVSTWDWNETSQFWPCWYNFSREPSQAPSCNVCQFLYLNIESTKHTWQSHHSRSNLHRMAEVFRSRKTSLSTNWRSHSRLSCRNHQKLRQLLQCFSSSEISKNKIIISVVMRQGKKKQATLYIEAANYGIV